MQDKWPRSYQRYELPLPIRRLLSNAHTEMIRYGSIDEARWVTRIAPPDWFMKKWHSKERVPGRERMKIREFFELVYFAMSNQDVVRTLEVSRIYCSTTGWVVDSAEELKPETYRRFAERITKLLAQLSESGKIKKGLN